MKSSEPPSNLVQPGKLSDYPLFSLYIPWLIELPELHTLSPLEFYVLTRFVRRTIEQNGEPVQDRVTEILRWLDLSVNTFNKAMDGLLAKGLMRKEKGELYAPLKYVVALPPLVEQLSAEPVEQQPPLCPMKPSSPIEGTLKEILRALLFLGGSRHLSAVRLAEMTGHSVGNVEMVVRELTLEMGKTSLRIDLTSSGYVMGTRPEFQDYTQKVLTKRQQPRRPSESELSVIAAIIAHGGPASRDEIADLRDKMPSGSLNSLLHSGLVGVTQSRKDGLPVYYLTPKLLDKYGFKSFEDLESFMKEHKAKSPIQETEIS